MNAPVVLCERKIKSSHKHQAPPKKPSCRAEFILSLVLYAKVRKSEKAQDKIQAAFSSIFSTLQFHSEEILRLSAENQQTSQQFLCMQTANAELKQIIDKLVLKLQQLEHDTEFERFKNKEMLQKHESLLSSIHTTKTRFSYVLDIVLLCLAYKAATNVAGRFQLSSLFKVTDGRVTGKGFIEKAVEIVALFLIFKSVRAAFSTSSTYAR